MDLDDTSHVVDITSYYLTVKERNARTSHTENLKEAGKEFARIGGFGSGRGTTIDYNVSAKIGEIFVEIPKECYRKYTKK